MFLGAMRKPDKAVAYKQLKSHLTLMGAFIVVVRITPYVLHYLSQEKEELRIEL